MLYEERRLVLRRGALQSYREIYVNELWPALEGLGARPLCLLSGLIGLTAETVHQFTGYRDAATWHACTGDLSGPPPAEVDGHAWARVVAARRKLAELVEEEQARLLHPFAARPKPITPVTDRRAVYGMRRFFIHPRDWPDFARYSSEGVWVRIEAQDARILGLFRDAAETDPLEVTLLTGYHGPAHWEETRFWRDKPVDFPAELWELGRRNQQARNGITLRSFVCLMNAHWPN